ncbi:MAG: molybdopterin-dependent oxidoreductase, partial [Pseudomonadota bacterium]
ECELQDLAMGYGRDVSRYTHQKRVVKDKNLGPLVSTDMTRCIHCTRCVRFGQEIAGIQELGTTGRGEHTEIGTFIEKSVNHELSGNIIDLCPVGALNNKPYRYSARAWEMVQKPTVSPHDCVGTNLNAHVLRGTVKRIVPRSNEAINETWIADRDRFSYEAIYSEDRLTSPRIKDANGDWQEASWDEALAAAAEVLQKTEPSSIGMLSSPSSTVEEQFLLRRIADTLGVSNIDHRLHQRDFSDDAGDSSAPNLGLSIADLESRDAILLLGSDIRAEAPLLAHRIRKAALAGAKVSTMGWRDHYVTFKWSANVQGDLVENLSALAKACGVKGESLPGALKTAVADSAVSDDVQSLASELDGAAQGSIVLGTGATAHPAFSAIRALARAIAAKTGCSIGGLSEGANAAGASLCGVLPHRGFNGEARQMPGHNTQAMLQSDLSTYLLLGVEPANDLQSADALAALRKAGTVIGLTAFASDDLLDVATILLPIGTFAETSGTYINVEGTWQSFAGIATPVGQSRPAWKVLRVLANLSGVDGAEYMSSDEVLDAASAVIGSARSESAESTTANVQKLNGEAGLLHIPIYEVDPLVRRAKALQMTEAGQAGARWRENAS